QGGRRSPSAPRTVPSSCPAPDGNATSGRRPVSSVTASTASFSHRLCQVRSWRTDSQALPGRLGLVCLAVVAGELKLRARGFVPQYGRVRVVLHDRGRPHRRDGTLGELVHRLGLVAPRGDQHQVFGAHDRGQPLGEAVGGYL